MPTEGQVFNYATGKESSEFDLSGSEGTDESKLQRQWSYFNGLGSQEFRERYINEKPFFFSTESNIVQIWMVFCELLFSLRRPHGFGDQFAKGGITNFWWGKHRDAAQSYLVYPEDNIKYGWVLYLDIESADDVVDRVTGQIGVLGGEPVGRTDLTMIFRGENVAEGGSESQAILRVGGAEGGVEAEKSTTPIDIPVFPKWSDKIKEKFHRSTDKDMSEWDKSLDDWQTEFQIALTN